MESKLRKVLPVALCSIVLIGIVASFAWSYFDVGINLARTKLGGSCSAVEKIGSYTGDTKDVAKQAALAVLKKRDSRITAQDVNVDWPAYKNFSTNPPTPSRGEIIFNVLHQDGTVEKREVESYDIVSISVDAGFFNRFGNSVRQCVGWIDEACVPFFLELVNGEIFLTIPTPC